MPQTSMSAYPSGPRPTYVAPEVSYLLDRIVNVVFVGRADAGDREWVLVDAGLPGSAAKIRAAAARLFGPDSRPASIVLTHGHFDHIGAVHTLAHEWAVPVYAHELELPYLTGRSSYPPPEPFVGGGLMAALSFVFPRAPIDLGSHAHVLPHDGSVPGMPGWRWIATPGHAPGHISLVRDKDRTLIAGDAFVMTKQESIRAAFTQRREMHGPPMYFTPDWDSAGKSVAALASYAPTTAITGHGPPMHGPALQAALHRLSAHFDELARPSSGRYRDEPAITDANGVVFVPPPVVSGQAIVASAAVIGAAIALGVVLGKRSRSQLVDESANDESAAESDKNSDDTLASSAKLAAADGGYDTTTPNTVATL